MQNPAAEQVVKVIKDSNNVLVTVKNNPSVDDLTAAIGLTLILNHMGKHAVTVFSGRVPSTLEFLQPEMAIDTNTDSLRDFIIALDKSKADKLRYKVEDNVVRIFITPYKTSISERDLEFSQGDFNVDAVVALGVVEKEDFDQAVTAHGRILHDATVVALTNHDTVSKIGAINWQEQQASSVSEMIASITDQLGDNVVDGQIATALMTGIVAETDRFRNASTTPQVLSISAKLMASGANQQLIAEKLEEPEMPQTVASLQNVESVDSGDDGALEISHDENEVQNINIDDNGNLELPEEIVTSAEAPILEQPATQPVDTDHAYLPSAEQPKLFGQDDSGVVTAQPLFDSPAEEQQPAVDTAQTSQESSYVHGKKVIEPLNGSEETVSPPAQTPSNEIQTLSDLEQTLGSPHLSQTNQNVDEFFGSTRPTAEQPQQSAVSQAITEAREQSEPPKEEKPVEQEEKKEEEPKQTDPLQQPPPQVVNPTAPPAVPPPLLPQANSQPQFFEADGTNSNPFSNPS